MILDSIIRAVQKAVAVTVDGKDGPETWRAIYKTITGKEWQDAITVPLSPDKEYFGIGTLTTVDARSEGNIKTLLPPVREYARALVHSARAQGIVIKVISGTRTYEEQDAIFAQGRTKEGKIVTKARGGFSNHNFGVAFDIGIFKGDAYLEESPLYKVVGALGRKLGLEWGGDWQSIVDEPHFQFNPKGRSTAEMRELVAAGKSVLA